MTFNQRVVGMSEQISGEREPPVEQASAKALRQIHEGCGRGQEVARTER